MRQPSPHTPWLVDVAILVFAAAVMFPLGPLLGSWAAVAAITLIGAATLRARFGIRLARRRRLMDLLRESLGGELGFGPDQPAGAIRPAAWTGGPETRPRQVRLRVHAAVDMEDPKWKSSVVKKISSRFGAPYKIDLLDVRHSQAVIGEVPPAERLAPVAEEARRTLRDLLGPDVSVKDAAVVDGALERIVVSHRAGVKVASAAIRSKVERAFTTLTPGRWRARWDLEKRVLTLELRPILPAAIPHPATELTAENMRRIPLGVSEDGETMIWYLKGTGPQCVVTGKTGTGKTVVIIGTVLEFVRRGWKVRICDPKRIEFMGMRGCPNVEVVATTVEDMVAVIHLTWLEMERRYELIEQGKAVEEDFEPMLLVLDEFRDFYGMVNAWYAQVKVTGMPRVCPVFEWVSSLAAKARSAQIHLQMGTQRPDAYFLDGGMRDNFDTRISLGRLSPQGAQMMWEAAHIGVGIPRGKPGRGTALDHDDQPAEFQAYWTPDPRRLSPGDSEDLEILRALMPAEAKYPQMEVQHATDLLVDLDDDGEKKKSKQLVSEWHATLDARLVRVVTPVPHPLDLAQSSNPADRWSFSKEETTRQAGTADEVARESRIEAPDVDDLDTDYGPLSQERPSRVRAGDLVLVDESLDHWAVVVADPEPSDVDEDLYVIEYRDDDDGGFIERPDEAHLEVRHPREHTEDEDGEAA